MTNSQAFLTEETSAKVDLWIAQYKIKTGDKIIKPNAINSILEEHFDLLKEVEKLRGEVIGEIVDIAHDCSFDGFNEELAKEKATHLITQLFDVIKAKTRD